MSIRSVFVCFRVTDRLFGRWCFPEVSLSLASTSSCSTSTTESKQLSCSDSLSQPMKHPHSLPPHADRWCWRRSGLRSSQLSWGDWVELVPPTSAALAAALAASQRRWRDACWRFLRAAKRSFSSVTGSGITARPCDWNSSWCSSSRWGAWARGLKCLSTEVSHQL